MMRRKSAAPRIIKNYRFAAYPLVEPPLEFWEQARAMNALWDEMVEKREKLSAELNELREADRLTAQAGSRRDPTSPAARLIHAKSAAEKTFWEEFDRHLVEITRRGDWKERLGDNARGYILENFRTASVRAFRDRGILRRKSTGLKNINIPHRFGEGGWAAERIFIGNAKKLHLNLLAPAVYEKNDWQSRRSRLTEGFVGYGLENRPLPLRVLMHRPLPAGGLVKTVKLVGTFDRLSRHWRWHLLIALQTAPAAELEPFQKPPVEKIAALDIGYRRRDDYLRIGYLLDTGGHQYELRLPIIEPPSRRLLNALKSVNTGREHNGLAALNVENFFPVTIFDVWKWQEKNDRLLERVKEKISEILKNPDPPEVGDTLPEEAVVLLEKLRLIRRTGLLKLWAVLSAAEKPVSEQLRRIHELLDEWKAGDLENLQKIKQTGTRLINKRNKLYENIALWLVNNFRHLVVGKNTSLRKIAEAAPKISLDSDQAAIKIGAKYRFFAGHYFLQRKLREKNDSGWLIEDETAHTGFCCHRCGAVCEPTGILKIVCPNGHEADQDFQSCRNRLDALPKELSYERLAAAAPVPEHLKKYIVRVEP